MILNTVMPVPGESYISFLIRMAVVNGMNDMDFCMTFTNDRKYYHHNPGQAFSGDPSGMHEVIYPLGQCLHDNHPLKADPRAFYLEHTLFPLYSMFFKTEADKENHVRICTEESDRFLVHTSFRRIDRHVYFCKSCIKQDMEKYGIPLIHLFHQSENVYVCPIHGETLCEENGESPDYFYTREYFNRLTPATHNLNRLYPGIAYPYSVFCKDLLENPIDAILPDLDETISNSLDRIPTYIYGSEGNSNRMECRWVLEHVMEVSGLMEYGLPKQKPFISNSIDKVQCGLALLFVLYRTADFAREMISKHGMADKSEAVRISANLISLDYTVQSTSVENYRTELVLKHNASGKIITTTLRKFANECGCPYPYPYAMKTMAKRMAMAL